MTRRRRYARPGERRPQHGPTARALTGRFLDSVHFGDEPAVGDSVEGAADQDRLDAGLGGGGGTGVGATGPPSMAGRPPAPPPPPAAPTVPAVADPRRLARTAAWAADGRLGSRVRTRCSRRATARRSGRPSEGASCGGTPEPPTGTPFGPGQPVGVPFRPAIPARVSVPSCQTTRRSNDLVSPSTPHLDAHAGTTRHRDPGYAPGCETLRAMAPKARRTTKVYLECGSKKVFACALDWPGWCRSGKTEEAALEALAAYAPRYAEVAEAAGVRLPASAATQLEVVERVEGNATTDFGALGMAAGADSAPVGAAEAKRLATFVQAAWTVLDRVAAAAPAELRKGPRGGGRDRDKMVKHVLDAESAYAGKIGIKHPGPDIDDRKAIDAMRGDILEVLRRPSDGGPLRPNGWNARYAGRRLAWHALDHAWEMQDRSTPG